MDRRWTGGGCGSSQFLHTTWISALQLGVHMCVFCRLSHPLFHQVALKQESAHIYKGPDGKYFWLHRPHMVSVAYFSLFLLQSFKNVKTIPSMQGTGKQVCRLEFADPCSQIIIETCSFCPWEIFRCPSPYHPGMIRVSFPCL